MLNSVSNNSRTYEINGNNHVNLTLHSKQIESEGLIQKIADIFNKIFELFFFCCSTKSAGEINVTQVQENSNHVNDKTITDTSAKHLQKKSNEQKFSNWKKEISSKSNAVQSSFKAYKIAHENVRNAVYSDIMRKKLDELFYKINSCNTSRVLISGEATLLRDDITYGPTKDRIKEMKEEATKLKKNLISTEKSLILNSSDIPKYFNKFKKTAEALADHVLSFNL